MVLLVSYYFAISTFEGSKASFMILLICCFFAIFLLFLQFQEKKIATADFEFGSRVFVSFSAKSFFSQSEFEQEQKLDLKFGNE